MKLIALDTCTEACSAALWIDGEIIERFTVAPREHTNLILPMLDELLGEAGMAPTEFDAIAFGRGPGAFTGVRIGIGVAQGIAFGAYLPVIPVSSLAAMAQAALEETLAETLLAVIDARMEEVYWGAFARGRDGVVSLIGQEGISRPEEMPIPEQGRIFGVGTGWQSYGKLLTERVGERLLGAAGERFPRASAVASLAAAEFAAGRHMDAELAEPVYLRDQVAKKKAANG